MCPGCGYAATHATQGTQATHATHGTPGAARTTVSRPRREIGSLFESRVPPTGRLPAAPRRDTVASPQTYLVEQTAEGHRTHDAELVFSRKAFLPRVPLDSLIPQLVPRIRMSISAVRTVRTSDDLIPARGPNPPDLRPLRDAAARIAIRVFRAHRNPPRARLTIIVCAQ